MIYVFDCLNTGVQRNISFQGINTKSVLYVHHVYINKQISNLFRGLIECTHIHIFIWACLIWRVQLNYIKI